MPAITPINFRDAVFGAFNTYWANRTVVAWPNLAFDPSSLDKSDTTAYVKPAIVDEPEGQQTRTTSVEPHLKSRSGSLGFELFTRGERSEDQSLELGDDLLAFLDRQHLAIPGLILSRRGMLPIGFQGVWFQRNVTAAFLYFTDRAS